MPACDIRLNAIIDADAAAGRDLAELAAILAAGGATLIQYRDKGSPTRVMVERASAIAAALAGTGVDFVVNDRVDVALASGADGVHLGRDDMDPDDARRLLGSRAILGLTVKNEADAARAVAARADYACIGGVFATLSKVNPEPPLGVDGFAALRRILAAAWADLPVGAIAGIDEARAAEVIASGADGVACIGVLLHAPDPKLAAAAMRDAVDRALEARR